MNPLREGLSHRAHPKPCNVVIFGASGDLTARKLVPALYNLQVDGELPASTRVIGFARREKTDESFRGELLDAAQKFSRQGADPAVWADFASRLHYHQGEFGNEEAYASLAKRLAEFDQNLGTAGNRLFYLSVAPSEFSGILSLLEKYGLNRAADGCWSRVIIEKPFGKDQASAHALNQTVSNVFHEDSIYRIDHYLGKETAQNIMVLRFANAIFEPLWNHRFIDHIQITASEPMGVEKRGPYYDASGALRDMVQNHLLQLLCLVAMEPPADLRPDSVRDEKLKVVRALRKKDSASILTDVVRGQYIAGDVMGKPAPAYRDEERVNPQSQTETFVAMKLQIDNWRWSGVPFYMRVGKRMPKHGGEIAIHFKRPPGVLFNSADAAPGANVLVIRIQPDEGISLRIQSKRPGTQLSLEPVKMDFHYGTSFGRPSPEAYERLILDAMVGDATLFARRDEVDAAWSFIDSIEHAWHAEDSSVPLCTYPAGSWGPAEADDLLGRDGRAWRRL